MATSKKSAPKKKAAKKAAPKKVAAKKAVPKKAVKKAVAKKAVKKAAPKKAVKKAAPKKKAAKKAAPPAIIAPPSPQPAADHSGRVCRLRQKRWWIFQPNPEGSLSAVDGPFGSQAECEENI